MRPTVLVLGATGQVGLFAIARLLEAGRHVIAVTRVSPARTCSTIDGLETIGWQDIHDRLANAQGIGNCYSLLSCGPVHLARELLLDDRLQEYTTWDRVVVTGTTSVLTKKASANSEERNMIAAIEAACVDIRDSCRARNLPLCILSPTLIYGCGLDQNLSRVYRWIQRFGFAPVALKSNGLRQPVHVDDLAQTLVNAVLNQPPAGIESPVCGAGTVPYDEMISRLFITAGKKTRLLRLPDALVPLVVGVSRLRPGEGGLNREMFRRQAQDLVFDDSIAREQLHHDSRIFNPGLRDFELPVSVAQIRKALLQERL